ncbi:LOW QUALITY PROTEIN: hypothetical protein NC652_011296 [Populus alba x Populus x berolinensis]|nr:LOW QUALITY PROTEIN: hypothetical protein NC652_011296 [Populus alba x Populus x berolinensis]
MNKHKCMVLGNQKCPHTPARAQASTYAFKLTFISKLGCKMRTGMVKYSEIISKRRQSTGSVSMNNSTKPTQVPSEYSDDEASSVVSREEALECPICWESFNIVENVPYVLWCGHTLCKNCVLGLQWAVVKFPTLPIRLPLFISCPWCNLSSFRFVYRGNLKFPRKNYFLLWMVESKNGDRDKSLGTFCEDHQSHWSSDSNLAHGSQVSRGTHHDHSHVNSYLNLERIHSFLQKSLAFFSDSKVPIGHHIPFDHLICNTCQCKPFWPCTFLSLFCLPSHRFSFFTLLILVWIGLWEKSSLDMQFSVKFAPRKSHNLFLGDVKTWKFNDFPVSKTTFVGIKAPWSHYPLYLPWLEALLLLILLVLGLFVVTMGFGGNNGPTKVVSLWMCNALVSCEGTYRAIRTRASIRFSSVSTNIRMTVIKLKSGGLWVHAPIAPTKECIQPPECISKESLLASAKNGLAAKLLSKGKEIPQEPAVDNQMNRQKGWERMVLQILFLGPSNLLEPNTSFAQMSQKLIVSPIVKTLVFSKVPEKIRDWIDSIVRDWKFKRIIPAHFAAPINSGRSEFLAAFAFLDDLLLERYVTRPSLSLLFTPIMGKAASYFPPDDMKTLSSLDQFLVSVGAVKKTVPGRKKTA